MSENKILNMISDQLCIEKSNIEFVEKGSEGSVYSFFDNNGSKKIIKTFSNAISAQKSFEEIKEKSEITEKFIQNSTKTLKILRSGSLKDEDGKEIFYQIFDFMEYNLLEVIYEDKINSYESYLIALKIIIGVCSLHKIGIAHRDLKLENVMINLRDEKVKIIDFGFAEKVEEDKEYLPNGTKEYAAPELFFHIINNENILATDIYALGILLFNLITKSGNLMNLINNKSKPFDRCLIDRLNYLKLLRKNSAKKDFLPDEPQEIRIKFLDLLEQMISIDPFDRPKIDEVLEKMVGIFLKIEEKCKIQKKDEFIELKPREKIIIEMLTNKKFFKIDKKEFENIAEKNTKKIRDILENNKTTNNLKNCVKQSINRILNDNIFKFTEEGKTEELNINESLKFAKIENHLREMVFIKNAYYLDEIKNKKQNKFIQSLEDITNFIKHNNNLEENKTSPIPS